ncbi:MAG: hypothetical protein U1F35_05505 [Steroidobacteraceae bacterium]
MAKTKGTSKATAKNNGRSSSPKHDGPPTKAEKRKAVAFLQQSGGAHLPQPKNRLIGDSPADTIERCTRVIDWFAHIEEPFHSDALEAAKADVLHGVVDALGFAERVLRQLGARAPVQS